MTPEQVDNEVETITDRLVWFTDDEIRLVFELVIRKLERRRGHYAERSPDRKIL